MKETHVRIEHLTETPIIVKELAEAGWLSDRQPQFLVILSGVPASRSEAGAQSKDLYLRKYV